MEIYQDPKIVQHIETMQEIWADIIETSRQKNYGMDNELMLILQHCAITLCAYFDSFSNGKKSLAQDERGFEVIDNLCKLLPSVCRTFINERLK